MFIYFNICRKKIDQTISSYQKFKKGLNILNDKHYTNLFIFYSSIDFKFFIFSFFPNTTFGRKKAQTVPNELYLLPVINNRPYFQKHILFASNLTVIRHLSTIQITPKFSINSFQLHYILSNFI